MKTIVHKLFFAAVFLLAASSLHAQSHYYGLSGDTIRERCPIYMYHWDWHEHVHPIGDEIKIADSVYDLMKLSSAFQGFHTDTSVRVLGVAMCVMIIDEPNSRWEFVEVFDPGAPQYMRLYDVVGDSIIEKASACWTENYASQSRRFMELVWSDQNPSRPCNEAYFDTIYLPVIECYFDSAITITDSFYVGSTNYEIYPDSIPEYPIFVYDSSIDIASEEYARLLEEWWKECNIIGMQHQEIELWRSRHRHYKFNLWIPPYSDNITCWAEIPPNHLLFLNNDGTFRRTVTVNEGSSILVFPIIEVDTVGMPYDTARLDCFVPDSLVLQRRFFNGAMLSWSPGRFNTSMQFSVTAYGGDPGDGRIINTTAMDHCTITGLDHDSTYDIYLRGWCDQSQRYSPWVGPLVISPLNGIESPEEEPVFSLAPNPARESVTLTAQEPLPLPATVTILDLQGRELRRETMHAQSHTISLKGLPAATYILRLDTPQGSSSRKLTVEGSKRAGR